MATYPIKMLKDENNTPFVPLVGANAIVYNDTETLEEKLDKKLEKTNIIAGDNITLSIDGNNITINGGAGSSIALIDNLTASMAGQGALDAHQGYVLKGMIDNLPRVIDDITSTSQTDALSANQGRVLNINKQDKLISGTNLKTINNESLLGSGNITVSASPEISIGTATPSDDEILWIDPTEDYINTTTEVVDNLNGNETSLAPSVRAVKNDLIKSGSNDNGFWIKYPDGTMICRGSKTLKDITFTQLATGINYSEPQNLSFPQQFISYDDIGMSVTCRTSNLAWVANVLPNISNFTFDIVHSSTTTRDVYVTWLAIGRWK